MDVDLFFRSPAGARYAPELVEGSIHTMPTFGRSHTARCDCWCRPEIANVDDMLACGCQARFQHHVEQ